MPKRTKKQNRRLVRIKKGKKTLAPKPQELELLERTIEFEQETGEQLYEEDNNNIYITQPEESEESSGCEATEEAQEWKEWYKEQQLKKMNEYAQKDASPERSESSYSSSESSENSSGSTYRPCREDTHNEFSTDSQYNTYNHVLSDESSEGSMTDISIYDSADEDSDMPTPTKDGDEVSDAEIIRRNNYASNFCRHEIGEHCECSQSKDFRNLDGEPVAHGKTYHGLS